MKELLLMLAVRLGPFLFAVPLLVLLRKENQIAKGERSDFSERDRTWAILLMTIPMALLLILLLVIHAAESFGEFLLLLLSVLLRNGILPVLCGAAVLALHAQNRKTLGRPDAAELQEKTKRRSDRAQRRLAVALPVLAVVGIAIAMVWRFCFPEKLLWLAIAYGVYILLGTIWLVWISQARDDEE